MSPAGKLYYPVILCSVCALLESKSCGIERRASNLWNVHSVDPNNGLSVNGWNWYIRTVQSDGCVLSQVLVVFTAVKTKQFIVVRFIHTDLRDKRHTFRVILVSTKTQLCMYEPFECVDNRTSAVVGTGHGTPARSRSPYVCWCCTCSSRTMPGTTPWLHTSDGFPKYQLHSQRTLTIQLLLWATCLLLSWNKPVSTTAPPAVFRGKFDWMQATKTTKLVEINNPQACMIGKNRCFLFSLILFWF